VPYRRTALVAARLSSSREALVAAALSLVAEGGYAAASPAAVTRRAEVATGTLYRHFPSKSALLAEVFRRASERELAVVRAAAATAPGGASAAVAAVVEAFARRALRGGRLAYALLSEPVDAAVEAERLVFRRDYRDLLAGIVAAGVARGELPAQQPQTTAAALVGATAEALVGPLSRTAAGGRVMPDMEADRLVADLVRFCVTALGVGGHQRLEDSHAE
jgi:AcrR family transcriptional regulator